MCGISGLIAQGYGSDPDLRGLALRMADRLLHRGPDAGGVWVEDGVALAHRRLAIVDLSEAGAQPMHSACGRYVLVFNGEIYNHLDLRESLDSVGATSDWRGHSDTETLLAAVAHWGIEETLRRSVGMFAAAVFDRLTRRLALFRDPMGEKPLYWGWAGKSLVFASELKAIREHPDCSRIICQEALADYLTVGYVPAPRSIHPGLYKLEPGCLLEVSADSFPLNPPDLPLRPGQRFGSLEIRRYWSLDSVIEAGAGMRLTDPAQATAAAESVLGAAVRRQMMADVPLGAFLSGGIDSSLIVALMQAQSTRRVQTFTVGFEARAFDESPFAADVALHLGTDHSTLRVSDAEARGVIPLLPELYDEPFADSSQIPTYLICRAARSSVKVALSGDGGDELFGGYNRYVLGPKIWQKIAPIPSWLRRYVAATLLAIPESSFDGLGRLHNAVRPPDKGIAALGQKMHRVAGRLERVQSIDDMYNDTTRIWTDYKQLLMEGRANEAPNRQVGPIHDSLPSSLQHDAAGRMMAFDMRSYLPDDILCKVDRAAMGASLETRVPFLDRDVVELSARIPPSFKIRNGQGKWLLRQILYRHLPRELIDRPKAGFSLPLGEWLRGPLRDWAEDLLSSVSLERDGLFNVATVRAIWNEHLKGRRDLSAQLWVILMFESWRCAQLSHT
jgi:asparagine synthase (glutamine-hydrolysing)